MEKLSSLFTSYSKMPSSPSIGMIRHRYTSRIFKPSFIGAAVVVTCFVLFLGTQNRRYIAQHLPGTLKGGKTLSPTWIDDSATSSGLNGKVPIPSNPTAGRHAFGLPPQTIAQIQNETLGFERVMIINLPKRSDKLDASMLAASLTGINLTVVEGIRNEDIAAKALPWNFAKDAPNVHGCWRAHVNAIRTIVSEGLSSALILEDDSDWDVNVKAQLSAIAAGTQKLQRTAEKHKAPHSPYGDNWDIFWLGHCASEAHSDTERMLIHNDPTVAPPSQRWNMWDPGYNAKGVTNNTRVVSKGNNAICMNGYAVSFAGAQKILYHASLEPNPDAIDQRINAMCDSNHKEYPEVECLHVYPSIFNAYRKAGRDDGDSDQGGHDDQKDAGMRESGSSFNNVYSTILNLGNLIQGKEAEIQWDFTGWENTRELDESEGVRLEWQEAGWETSASGGANNPKEEEEKKR